MDADGTNQQRLTNNPIMVDRGPSWSPDSSRIVFSSARKQDGWNDRIYVMDADGSNQLHLTTRPIVEGDDSSTP